ncbi:hypothetical protein K2Q16_02465 [Patescibacteria group bacterium]|nr:hypothetical protein [Patescibacteria group bacterium]
MSAVDKLNNSENVYAQLLGAPEKILQALTALHQFSATLAPPHRLTSNEFAEEVSRAVNVGAPRNSGPFIALLKALKKMGLIEEAVLALTYKYPANKRYIQVSALGIKMVEWGLDFSRKEKALTSIKELVGKNVPLYAPPPSGSS